MLDSQSEGANVPAGRGKPSVNGDPSGVSAGWPAGRDDLPAGRGSLLRTVMTFLAFSPFGLLASCFSTCWDGHVRLGVAGRAILILHVRIVRVRIFYRMVFYAFCMTSSAWAS